MQTNLLKNIYEYLSQVCFYYKPKLDFYVHKTHINFVFLLLHYYIDLYFVLVVFFYISTILNYFHSIL